MALDVARRAEIDRAFDAQDLELRTFDKAVLDLGHLALAVARVGNEASHDRVRGAVEVEHERREHPDEDRELELEQERREESGGDHPALAPAGGKNLAHARKLDQAPDRATQYAR